MDKKIGVVTINFNTEDMLDRLIKCFNAQTYKKWIMVIVNNSDNDATIKEVIKNYDDEQIKLLSINKNVGYSRGNNAGFEYLLENRFISEKDIVLFTNEDIVIENNQLLEEAIKRVEVSGCGFWGPKIINTDGSMMLPHLKKSNFLKCLLHMGNNGIVDRIFGVNRKVKNINEPTNVFLLNGAFFICKAEDFIRVDKLDENTFIYYEEELLYRKVSDNKIKVIYDPTLYVLHEHSASVKKSFSIRKKKKFVYEGELYFLEKILKINKFLKFIFKLERNIEFAAYRVVEFLKNKKK
jgi:GT2 family glycosyltransferase